MMKTEMDPRSKIERDIRDSERGEVMQSLKPNDLAGSMSERSERLATMPAEGFKESRILDEEGRYRTRESISESKRAQ